jgi:hypothetical protein
MNSEKLLQTLESSVSAITSLTHELLNTHSNEILNKKESPTQWSILECYEHLNRYARYYVPHIKQQIHELSASQNHVIKTGWLKQKLIDGVKPSDKKMKTLKRFNPSNSALDVTTINEFLQHQQTIITTLHSIQNKNLNQGKVPLEFFKLIQFSVAEALQVVVYHQNRHQEQILRIKERLKNQGATLVV